MIGEREVGTLLTGTPKNWYSWDYEFRDGSTLVASLELEWLHERGTLRIGSSSSELGREGWYSGAFFLKQGGRLLATAQKPSAMFRSFQVKFDAAMYCWEAESTWTRAFVLREGNQVLGCLRPESVFARRATLELPEELALDRRVFLAWLAILVWRRQQNAG